MAEYIVQDTSLTPIADEIRVLSGVSNKLSLSAMAKNTKDANSEVDTQTDLLAQVLEALSGKAGGGLPDGVSAIASGTFTPTSNITSGYSVAHGLGVIPSFFIVTVVGSFTYGSAFVSSYFVRANYTDSGNNNYIGTQQYLYLNGSKGLASGRDGIKAIRNVANSTNIIVPAFSSGRLLSGVEYRWIAGVIDGLN